MGAPTIGAAGALAAGGAVLTGIVMLFERNQRGALEAKSYVHSIHEAAEGWVQHTQALTAELRRVPEQTARLSELAAAYVEARSRS